MKDSSSRFVASYLVKFKGRINFLRLMQNAYYFFLSNHNVQLQDAVISHIFYWLGKWFFLVALFLEFKYIQTIIYSIHRGPIIKSNKRKGSYDNCSELENLLFFVPDFYLERSQVSALKVDRFCINYKFLNGSAQTKAKQGEINHNL